MCVEEEESLYYDDRMENYMSRDTMLTSYALHKAMKDEFITNFIQEASYGPVL